MHLVHTTKDGERMFIAQMADSHLQNTINLILRQLETGLQLTNAQADVTEREAVIFGIDIEKIKQHSKKIVPQVLKIIYPYLAEALLRWGDAHKKKDKGSANNAKYLLLVTKRLREITGRTKKMEPLGLVSALPEGVRLKQLEHSMAGESERLIDYDDDEPNPNW